MKELSIEQKAKRYDEAIERAKKWRNAPNSDKIPTFANRVIEEIFPELKESEDEKIRKDIINFIKNSKPLRPKEWIAWLEKQGEQKSIIIPKFRVGDNVRLKGSCGWYNVKEIRDTEYYLTADGTTVPCLLSICEQDNWEVEQKPVDYDIDVLERHITKDSVSDLAHTVIVRNGWKIVEKEQKLVDWSVGDKEVLGLIKDAVWNYWDEKQIERVNDWLKSLPPQSHWKPSEEQMKLIGALSKYDTIDSYNKEVLKGFYEQLKAL